MTTPLRVYVRQLTDGFAAAVGNVESDKMFWLMKSQNKVSLASGWVQAKLEWHQNRRTDKTPNVTDAFGYGGVMCFSRALLPKLFPMPAPGLEFLAAHVDGEDWVLLNCLRVTASIDKASSDIQVLEVEGGPPSIIDIRWINVVDREALDWDVFCIPGSANPEVPRRFLVTDRFVDRYHSLGLKGLDFKHVGYIVADAAQAVPKPPTPPAPPPKPSKRKPPELTSGPMPTDEQIELAGVCADWRQRLQLRVDTEREVVLRRITDKLQELRPVFWTIGADERIDASLGLAAIYGELLRSACGWSWAELRESRSKRWFGVVSPTGTHALALVPYVQQQIQSEAPTVTLLFNMIVAGQLPPAEPGQLVLVG